MWRQLSIAGLDAVAEKVAAGSDLNLDEALALSRAGLPLLGKLVQLRLAILITPTMSTRRAPWTHGRPDVPGSSPAAGPLPFERVTAVPDSPQPIGQPLADWESFCRTLIATRGELLPGETATFWYPIAGRPFDGELGCDGGFTGVNVLRAIALARLILPAKVEVMAPLATLGPKLAQVALNFGASHLGYVAIDGQTPNDPLLAAPSLLDELLGSCQLTALEDEPS